MSCLKSKNRNRREQDNVDDEEDKQQIDSIVCKKSMVIIFNILFMVNNLF
jgi:hypothetical protein